MGKMSDRIMNKKRQTEDDKNIVYVGDAEQVILNGKQYTIAYLKTYVRDEKEVRDVLEKTIVASKENGLGEMIGACMYPDHENDWVVIVSSTDKSLDVGKGSEVKEFFNLNTPLVVTDEREFESYLNFTGGLEELLLNVDKELIPLDELMSKPNPMSLLGLKRVYQYFSKMKEKILQTD